jgi:hypothetical protein
MEEDLENEIDHEFLGIEYPLLEDQDDSVDTDIIKVPDLFEETDKVTHAYNILKEYADANCLPILQTLTPARFYDYIQKQ